ncbi:dicarboxylate/amino acid:cation symporter [Oceanobacillus piezotolerans]|uniref:Dicarboxylate/amino acid:cation symporter n=1 Tax=Oceanobacillus piezotolerans TaxID=2448030 RepID=A0A498D513_9BACI|nr:dicarboxylate/amino acid:cation symporter [Oceanobacillus piezotolerans]RLL43936.1 dicarboxylate/amino acid:cation symporter [Oceanobacillus piezotolerans]
MKLSTKITVSLLLGIIAGIILNLFFPNIVPNLDQYVLSPLGAIFLRSIQFVVVPIVFTSLIVGFTSIKNPEKVGRLTGKLLSLYIVTNLVALVIGIATAAILKPGNSVSNIGELSKQEAPESQGIIDWLVSIIPTNPFESFSSGNLLQIIFTAILIIIGIRLAGEKANPFITFVESFHEIVGKITSVVLKLSPIGVFALICSIIATQGIELVQNLIMYIIGLILAVIVMIFVYFLFLSLMKISPIRFWKSFLPAFGIAFGTSSSNAALPVAIENAQGPFKMKKEIASFAISLGTALKRDGACIMQGFNALFVAQLFNVEITPTLIISIMVSTVIVSFSTAGVPGAGIIMMSTVLTAAGLPLEGIAIVAGIDRLTEGFRTLLNVLGNTANAAMLDKWEPTAEQDKATA